jgi:succinate dehydrogenase/fumarate reductase flavoprotein subunit
MWSAIRDHFGGEGLEALRSREAASLTATARWCYAAALARTETRGIHRRTDMPATDSAQAHRLLVTGTDRPSISALTLRSEALAS